MHEHRGQLLWLEWAGHDPPTLVWKAARLSRNFGRATEELPEGIAACLAFAVAVARRNAACFGASASRSPSSLRRGQEIGRESAKQVQSDEDLESKSKRMRKTG